MCLMQRKRQNYRVIIPPAVPQVQNSVSLDPPVDVLISTPISISHTPQCPPKHIVIVLRGITFRDCTLGTLMIGETLTPL